MNASSYSEGSGEKTEQSLGYSSYLRFSKLLLDRYGLQFPASRRADLERGVLHAFASSTCRSLEEYYGLLQETRKDSVEIDRLVNAVTINESHFFRDTGQFDALYSYVLPRIIESKKVSRTIRIWSAGCAGGEEPYSIAMLLRELLPDADEWAITILGTDVNTESLARARKAVYGEWAFREERAKQWRLRYFKAHDHRYELAPEVRRMVTFSRLNLAEDSYPAYETNTTFMDLILCRNVTIYFSEVVTARVVDRFYESLLNGGWLVIGHSEHSSMTYRHFQTRNFPNAILYQRVDQPVAVNWSFPPRPQKTDAPPVVTTPAAPPVVPPPVSPPQGDRYIRPSRESDTLDYAQELLDYGRSEEALNLLLEANKAKPGNSLTCELLGRAYANLGCWSEAEHWCRKAVCFDKLALRAYYTLALVLQHQGNLDQAIDAMKKVIYINRNYVLGHFGLADLYQSGGHLAQAQKSLVNAFRLLESHQADELIPDSGGVTVGRLREAIIHQQQQWGLRGSA